MAGKFMALNEKAELQRLLKITQQTELNANPQGFFGDYDMLG